MCNKSDNSCREEKLGCKGCFYNTDKLRFKQEFNSLYGKEVTDKVYSIELSERGYGQKQHKKEMLKRKVERLKDCLEKEIERKINFNEPILEYVESYIKLVNLLIKML